MESKSIVQATSSRQRIDIMKAFCIIALVLGHTRSQFAVLVYMFHMPALFLLSGYTYSGEQYSWWEYCKCKLLSLIVPFALINFLFTGFSKLLDIFGVYSFLSTSDFVGFKQSILTLVQFLGVTDFGSATWFLVVLFFAEIFFKTIQECIRGSGFDWLVGCTVGVIAWLMMSNGLVLPYMLDLGVYACLYFSIGVVLSRKKVIATNINHVFVIPVAVVTTCYFGKVFFAGRLAMNWPTRTFENPLIQLVSALPCIYFLYILSKPLQRCTKISKYFIYIGQHTFSIFGLHFLGFRLFTTALVVVGILPLTSLAEFPTPIGTDQLWLPYTLFAIVFSCICSWVASKNRWTNYCINAVLPKKKGLLLVYLQDKTQRYTQLRYAGYALLFLCLYYLILKFVFPGYFHPLVPHHTDILDYPYDARVYTLTTLFTEGARPIGLLLTWFFGLFGAYRGVMVSGIIVTLAAMLLIIYAVEKETNKKPWLGAIILYAGVIFTSTSFYLNYTFDIYNTYALLFSTMTIALWYFCRERQTNAAYYMAVCVLGICNFLCKETYMVSLCFFFFVKAFLEKGTVRRKAQVSLFITILTASGAMLQAKLAKSVYAAMEAYDVTHPYYSSIAFSDLLRTAKFYLQAFWNPWIVGLVMVCMVLLIWHKRANSLGMVLLSAIGAMALIPYFVLPNKTILHYFFVAYIFFFSILLIVDIDLLKNCPLFTAKKVPDDFLKAVTAVVLVVCVVGSIRFYNTNAGANSYIVARGWLANEQPAKITLESAPAINSAVQPGDQVLVLGIEESIETAYRGNHADTFFRPDATFFVATNYEAFAGTIAPNITYIYASEITDVSTYDVIVNYTYDGFNIER